MKSAGKRSILRLTGRLAELFQTTIQNINLHLQNIYEEGELDPGATIKSYLIVRTEGTRQVRRAVQHYNLEAILAVVNRQAHGARRRHFFQGDGAKFFSGSWGQSRVIGSGFGQGHGASDFSGSWGQPRA
jgi:hypothetical protein